MKNARQKPPTPRISRGEVVIEKLVAGGQGLARIATDDGRAEIVLVPRVAPGERVAVEIDSSKRPAKGRLLKVLEPASTRVDPRCAVSDRCGGCDLMHLSPDAQREVRLAILREALGPHGERDIVYHAATPERGRTRARFHAKSLGGGRVVLGYRALGASTIVDLEGCPILDARLEAALPIARSLLATARGDGDIDAALGDRGLPVLSIHWDGELPPATFAEAEKRVNSGELAGVDLSMRGMSTPARVGDPRPMTSAIDGTPLWSPPGGFAQASEMGDRVLVELVVQRAQSSGLRVAELFSGSGNFTVALARVAAHVTAIELSKAASEITRENLRARGLEKNAKVVNADADAWPIPSGIDVVVLDPPRTGARGAVKAIVERKVRRVVYVSCDPTTLARDLATLTPMYAIESIDAVDLFPETSHVETVVTLVRAK